MMPVHSHRPEALRPETDRQPLAVDIAFIVVAGAIVEAFAALLGGAVLGGSVREAGVLLAGALHVALFTHIGVSLYVGGLSGARLYSWLGLVGWYAALQLAAFGAYVLPWGQMSFWLAANAPLLAHLLPPATGAPFMGGPGVPVGMIVLLALLVVDFALAQRWRRSKRVRQILGTLVVLQIAVTTVTWWVLIMPGFPVAGDAFAPDDSFGELGFGEEDAEGSAFGFNESWGGGFGPAAQIVPEWYALPFYTVLRAVPGKLLGVVVMLAVFALPLVAPWHRAEKLREGAVRWWWRGANLLLALSFAALGWLGAMAPEGSVAAWSLVLALYVFAHFLVVPFALRAVAGRQRMASRV